MNVDGCFTVQAQLVQSELACCPAVQSYSVSIKVVPAPLLSVFTRFPVKWGGNNIQIAML